MSFTKRALEEKWAKYGHCRSQRQKGPAALFSCILWTGHDGEHKRPGASWMAGEGYEPTPEEIAALEAEESDYLALDEED